MTPAQIQAQRDEALAILRELAAEAAMHAQIVREQQPQGDRSELVDEAEHHARIIREKVAEVEKLVRVLARDTTFGPPPAPS